METTNDPFPTFNPERDLQIGHFVLLTVEKKEVPAEVPFFVGKVMEFGQRKWAMKVKVIWYWPFMKAGVHNETRSQTQQYTNCIETMREPSGERHGWVDKEVAIFSWTYVLARSRSGHLKSKFISIYGVHTENQMTIPIEAKPHILEYIAMQMEGMDDERLQNELEVD